MSRWTIEKSGTGIEKSGTGIEKSGTGIEKSGTGIEKSGTGIRKGLLALSIAALAFSTQVGAAKIAPEGAMQVFAENGQLMISWYFEGSLYTGAAHQQGTYARTSVSNQTLVVGGGTGTAGIQVVGGGTGTAGLIIGQGTDNESIVLGTNMQFELILSCNSAQVFVLDSNNVEVVMFDNVQVMGNTGLCSDDDGALW